jgi:predicted GIY-YIG superfamily endonuclease
MVTIYVLACNEGKYYVGRTARKLEDRVVEHFTSNGSEWTRKYHPLKVAEKFETDDMLDEDKWTKKYMRAHGIDKVRGGSYSTIQLSSAQLEVLNMEFRNADDLCFYCGSSDHFVAGCPEKLKSTSIFDACLNFLSKLFESSNNVKNDKPDYKSIQNDKDVCFRCGRSGHWVKDCYAKRHVNGRYLN